MNAYRRNDKGDHIELAGEGERGGGGREESSAAGKKEAPREERGRATSEPGLKTEG
jgi:hypothetical protein